MSLLPKEHWFDMDRFFDNYLSPAVKDENTKFFAPRVDITEKGNFYEIVGELPGVKKEDINVQLHDGVLTIEAKTNEETKSEDDKVIRRERRSGFYSRSFTLGPNVNESDISATFKDGLLTLTAPKQTEQVTEKRRININ